MITQRYLANSHSTMPGIFIINDSKPLPPPVHAASNVSKAAPKVIAASAASLPATVGKIAVMHLNSYDVSE